MLKAPFPYAGGKSSVAQQVWALLGDVPNYVEPLCGSAAVLLARPHAPRTETINDADGFLVNAYRAIRDDPHATAAWAAWPVSECCPAGTMIATPDGHIPIEQISVGMVVLGECNGVVGPTTVIATTQSKSSSLYRIGPLIVTGNHPIWTAEEGYLPAKHLDAGMHVKTLNWPVDECDLVMLYSTHEKQVMGNLHIDRSPDGNRAVCWCDVSSESTLSGTSLSCGERWENTPRLLDSISAAVWSASDVRSGRDRRGRRLAGSRETVDRSVSPEHRPRESHRWRRGMSWVSPDARIATEVVSDARRSSLSTRTSLWYEGETPLRRSQAQNQCSQPTAAVWTGHTGAHVTCGKAEGDHTRNQSQNDSRQWNCEKNRGISAASAAGTQASEQADHARREWPDLPFHQGCGTNHQCHTERHSICPQTTYPLQRLHPSTPVTVYNFQTSTGNYFANRILVHNCDLHARHVWLIAQRETLTARLEGDPDFYDPKVAGWWLWGACSWIGSGWCRGQGPWQVRDGQLLHLGAAGRGIHRQLPHLGDAGQGIHRKLPHLGNAGRGIHRNLPHLGNAGQDDGLLVYFDALAARLHRVRITCGPWARVLGPSVTTHHGVTGIFLDPPYRDDEHSFGYVAGGHVWEDCWAWAVAHGTDPLFRIVICGYDDGAALPEGWQVLPWKARGGYGSQGHGRGRINAGRERLYVSPHCLPLTPQDLPLFAEIDESWP